MLMMSNEERPMRGDVNFVELANVEEEGTRCLENLESEVSSLRKELELELEKEKALKGEEVELESKISVTREKELDLDIHTFQNDIQTLKNLISETEQNSTTLYAQTIQNSCETTQDLVELVDQFESKRLQFKNEKVLENGVKTKEIQNDQLAQRIKKISDDIQALDDTLSFNIFNIQNLAHILTTLETRLGHLKTKNAEQRSKVRNF